jgi:hypothetical protein
VAELDQFAAGELVAMSTANCWDPRLVCCSTFPFDHCDAVVRGPLGRYLHHIGVEIQTGTTAQSLALSERHWSERALSLSTNVTFTLDSGADINADALILATDPARMGLPLSLTPTTPSQLRPKGGHARAALGAGRRWHSLPPSRRPHGTRSHHPASFAGNHLLSGWNLRGHDLWNRPNAWPAQRPAG